MIKRLISISIFGVLVLFGAIYYFNYIYVPKGEEFDLKYTNLGVAGTVGDIQEEKKEFTGHGLYTRTKFLRAGDAIEYTFDIINDGTITAVLKRDPMYLKLDQYTKKHIEYSILYSNGDKIKKGDTIEVGETKSFKVRLTYKNSPEFESIDSDFYESNTYLMYVQQR